MDKITGDLLEYAREGMFDVIIHGCNCFCTMGAGIAKQIKDQHPEAYAADKKTKSGDRKKLGDYTSAQIIHIPRDTNIQKPGISFVIVNAYTQYNYTRSKIDVDYDAIRSVMRKVNKDFKGRRVGYPLIGAGLAGGDWNIISKIIDEELTDVEHTLVEFDPTKKAEETKQIQDAGRRVMDAIKGRDINA